jgi:uncharacterized protein YjlB
MITLNANPDIMVLRFERTKAVPNSTLPVLVYKRAIAISGSPLEPRLEERLRALVLRHGWNVDWIESDAVYRYTHYHSTAHEVLVVLDEVAELRLGGANGKEVRVGPGDLIAIPAGVAHRRISGNKDFRVAGLYTDGSAWDLLRQTRRDYKLALQNLPGVELPIADPFYGKDGSLMQYWK